MRFEKEHQWWQQSGEDSSEIELFNRNIIIGENHKILDIFL